MKRNASEVSVDRLGEQQKEILRFLYEKSDERFRHGELVNELYGEVTPSREASVRRSMSTLQAHEVVAAQTKTAILDRDYEPSTRIHYRITDAGKRFLERDRRFPKIRPRD